MMKDHNDVSHQSRSDVDQDIEELQRFKFIKEGNHSHFRNKMQMRYNTPQRNKS